MKYQGEFHDGKMHGKGKYWKKKSQHGSAGIDGIWENGIRVNHTNL